MGVLAADEADDPHAIEHDGIASDNKNGDACMASPPPLPPLPVWQTSLTRYNTNNNSWLVAVDGIIFSLFYVILKVPPGSFA